MTDENRTPSVDIDWQMHLYAAFHTRRLAKYVLLMLAPQARCGRITASMRVDAARAELTRAMAAAQKAYDDAVAASLARYHYLVEKRRVAQASSLVDAGPKTVAYSRHEHENSRQRADAAPCERHRAVYLGRIKSLGAPSTAPPADATPSECNICYADTVSCRTFIQPRERPRRRRSLTLVDRCGIRKLRT